MFGSDLLEAVLASLFSAWVGWGTIHGLIEGKLETAFGTCTRIDMPAGFWLMIGLGAAGATTSGYWASDRFAALLTPL